MKPLVIRADARRLPLPDASIDLIITSPPYYALRSYTDSCARCRAMRADGIDPSASPDWDHHVRIAHHYAGQVGSEATPAEYIAALVECTREWVRVLKPAGSIFVNLGDKYAAGHGGSSTEGNGVNITVRRNSGPNFRERPDLPNPPASWGRRDATGRNIVPGLRPKSLMLLPERYRIACVDELGLIARAVLVWSKPNGLPESVTDRVRRSHEDWVHLTKQPRYFAAVDEIRVPQTGGSAFGRAKSRAGIPGGPNGQWHEKIVANGDRAGVYGSTDPSQFNPLGKLPGSVWEVPTEPLKVPEHLGVDHFAAFPSHWPKQLILAWSPSGVCTVCGEGRRPVTQQTTSGRTSSQARGGGNSRENGHADFSHINRSQWQEGVTRTITYACACTPYTDHPERRGKDFHAGTDRARQGMNDGNGGERYKRYVEDLANPRGPVREYHLTDWTPPPTRPAVVLDPFGGTGTTAHVAVALGRVGISVDLSGDYCRLAAASELREARRRKVLGLDKPPAVPEGQLAFDDEVPA